MATLSDEQEFYIRKILKTIEKKGQALFAIISPGGTGKSFFIKKFETFFEKGLTLETVAPTNLTAIAIDAKTIYAFCGWTPDRSKWDLKGYDHDPNLQIVIADEVGLMDAQMLEGLNTRKKRNDAPFGGCSVILVGDFLQLPAIGDIDNKTDERDTPQLFEAPSWDLFELIKFKTNHRQSGDAHQQERLDRWRVGRVNTEDIQYLKDRTICTRFMDYNLVASKMAGWYKEADNPQSFIVAPFRTSVTKFNNLVCQHLGFTHKAVKEPSGYIEVNFPRIGRSMRIPRGLPHQSFAFKMDNAYALTIHKEQGKTLENVILDTSLARVPTDMTEFMKPGAFYTAASRVTKGSNFYITELWHVKNNL